MSPAEAAQRALVATEALSWQRTPYRHAGRLKGPQGGVDCGMFPLLVYQAAGVITGPLPVIRYSAQWHLHQRAEVYMLLIRQYAREIPLADLRSGDFALWKYENTFSHGAIVLEPPQIIHATIAGRMVHLDDFAGQGEDRPVKFFSPWGG